MSKNQRMHITGTRGNWKGQVEGNSRASFTAKTKAEATQKGVEQMKKAEDQLIVHTTDGKFQEERTYGKDPYPPKG